MDGKAGIPSNIPPHTDFTFQIHRIETKKQEENRKAQIQAETGLHTHHNQEPREKMMTPKTVLLLAGELNPFHQWDLNFSIKNGIFQGTKECDE